MGLSYIREVGKKGKLGLWRIAESVDELKNLKQASREDMRMLDSFTNDTRKKEWLASRILVEKLIEEKAEIFYDEHNKPFLKNSKKHISLSHSHNFMAVIIDDKETGIDIELIKPNVLKIKEKFMNNDELNAVGKENIAEKLTLYWCVKESLYKYYGKRKLTFKENLMVEPCPTASFRRALEYKEKGTVAARIHHGTMKKKFELNYEFISAYGQKYMMAYIVKEV